MGSFSSGEREYAVLVAQLRALDQDIRTARAVASPKRRSGGGLDLSAPHDAPAASGEPVALADGAQVLIRAVKPADRHEIELGFEHLSALSRLRRFRQPIEHLTPRELSELVDVDHESREALVALGPNGECVGAARFVRDAGDPAQADVTCTVADQWQRRGVGTALIERLAARAHALGIERFTATILVGNEPARRLVHRVAGDVTEHREGSTIEVDGEWP